MWRIVMVGMALMTVGFLVLSMMHLGWGLAIGGLLISPFPGLVLAVGTLLASDADDISV